MLSHCLIRESRLTKSLLEIFFKTSGNVKFHTLELKQLPGFSFVLHTKKNNVKMIYCWFVVVVAGFFSKI